MKTEPRIESKAPAICTTDQQKIKGDNFFKKQKQIFYALFPLYLEDE